MAPVNEQYNPSHPDLIRVNFEEGSYKSSLLANKDYKAGSRIVTLDRLIFDQPKAYSSVQYEKDAHFELNSDFVYMNHSCDPQCELIVDKKEDMHFLARRDIKKGDTLTFFYPSTEWEMNQPFDCSCGSKLCLGEIRGAKFLTMDQLSSRGHVNQHIRDLKQHDRN